MKQRLPRLRTSALICGAALLGLLAPASARGQAESDAWQVNITPYLWVPSLSTTLSIDDVPVEAESDTDGVDILSKLDFALLIGGEVRKGKVGLLYDFQYLKLSDDDGETRGPAPRQVDIGITFADATLALQYRLVEQTNFTLDGFGGGRAMYAKTELDVAAGAVLPAFGGDQSKTWIDPIVGAKCRYRMGEKWALNGYADIGGFGVSSDLTYQLLGTLSYSFNEHIALQGGYRAFAVDFEDGGYTFDVVMHGPIVGLTFSF
jgi:hypothetical protein